MDLQNLYGICNTLKSRVEALEREKLEREKLDRQKTNETMEMQQTENVAERQQLEKVAEMQQPEKVAERQQPSDKASCNPVSFRDIPEVIPLFIKSEIFKYLFFSIMILMFIFISQWFRVCFLLTYI